MLEYRECNLSEIAPPGCDANDVGADDPIFRGTVVDSPLSPRDDLLSNSMLG